MATFAVALLVVAFLLMALALSAFFTSLLVGLVGAFFFSEGFAVGFEAAWDNPWRLVALTLILGTMTGGSAVRRK